MLSWQFLILIFRYSIIFQIFIKEVDTSILQTVLGLPSECVHQNIVRPCKLSFSCWLQGGKHVQGCGTNKWLFSCCVSENEISRPLSLPSALQSQSSSSSLSLSSSTLLSQKSSKKSVALPKRTMLRRRDDNEVFQQMECGLPKTPQNTLQKRIIGGRPAHFAEYPWQAHIRIAEYQCGGVLVSKNYVATAAHCIQQARLQDIVVYLGELDTQNSGIFLEPLPSEKHRVLQKIIHPRFQFRMTQPDRYDLALLKLARPTGYTNHILPICLPNHPIDLIGRKGIIAGWGKTEANIGHSGTNILQTASVPIISASDCVKWHESKRINVELFSEMFCAGHSDGHQDACLGDSGGPLIVKDHGRYTLIGITSAGFGCGVDHQPGIYHNIQKTTKWIQEIVNRN